MANKVGLSEVYDWFLGNNPSAGLPYHNERHTNFMMNKVYEAGWITGCSIKDLKILVLAAMFHDFNHSGGEL
ncbi:hypothetical protein, partial [Vibrio vulnificus]|uniref:hypothetical protein n=1 Tax=Vibrio vulnificus TaxID=672 RepID=UPI0039B52461